MCKAGIYCIILLPPLATFQDNFSYFMSGQNIAAAGNFISFFISFLYLYFVFLDNMK